MSQKTTFSSKITPRRKQQLRLLADVQIQIANAIDDLRQEGLALNKKRLATKLGWDPAALTRKLKPTANLELESVADFAFALGRRPVVFFVKATEERAVRLLVQRVCVNRDPVIPISREQILNAASSGESLVNHASVEATDTPYIPSVRAEGSETPALLLAA